MSQSLRPDKSGSSERNRNQLRRVRGGSDGFVSVLLCPLPSRLDRRREESLFWTNGKLLGWPAARFIVPRKQAVERFSMAKPVRKSCCPSDRLVVTFSWSSSSSSRSLKDRTQVWIFHHLYLHIPTDSRCTSTASCTLLLFSALTTANRRRPNSALCKGSIKVKGSRD